MSQKYHIQSNNTKFYIISRNGDKDGQKVTTEDGTKSIPTDSTVTLTPAVAGVPTIVTITGVNGLYVALQSTAEGTYLTWSKEAYKWITSLTHAGSNYHYVTPATGQDLYWFDEFNVGIGHAVIVKAGKNIKAPQSEWVFIRNHRLADSTSG